jgi:hypothetical protein
VVVVTDIGTACLLMKEVLTAVPYKAGVVAITICFFCFGF